MNPDALRRTGKVADRLALACLAAMVSLPFLHPRHYNPIPSFWSEWWAFAFGLAAVALLLIRPGVWRPFGLPAVAAIPLVLLVTALLQHFAGRWYFVETWLICVAYLVWAGMMMLAGRSLAERRGLDLLVDTLAVAILFGALVNTAMAALQFHDVGVHGGWVFVRLGTVPYSNLGQANHFNHELWLGIASLYYLHARRQCRLAFLLPALLILLLAATMSTSKSILLYAIAFTTLAGLMQRRDPASSEARQLWRLTLPLLPTVLLLQWLVAALGIAGDDSLPLAMQRLFSQVVGYQLRWRLIRGAWDVFLQVPLLGSGIGTLPWQFFVDNSRYPLGAGPGVAEHAHNLPLQLLAEFGIVPVAIMLWLLARWALALWRQPWRIEHWWLTALLSVAAIHSMLEYPLWYSFFLGPTALLLGASARPAMMLNSGRRGAAICTLVIGVGIVPLVSMRLDYARLETLANAPVAASADARKEKIGDMTRIRQHSLLSPQIMASLVTMMEVDDKDLGAKVELCDRAMKFAPSRHIVFKCAELMALARDEAGALQLSELALQAYPKEAVTFVASLDALAPRYPRLKPLQPLALRYAEQAKSLP